jgi:hypothetical protein
VDPNAVGGGAFRKVDALVIIRDAAADDVHPGCFELVEQGVLISHAVTHGINDVDAHHQVLSTGPSESEKDHNRESCNWPTALYPAHPIPPDKCQRTKTEALVTPVQTRIGLPEFRSSAIEDELTLGRLNYETLRHLPNGDCTGHTAAAPPTEKTVEILRANRVIK